MAASRGKMRVASGKEPTGARAATGTMQEDPSSAEPPPILNKLTHTIIGAAMRVHSELGPGLLESAYVTCLVHALEDEGLEVAREVVIPARFGGDELDAYYRIDLIVEDEMVLEVKACKQIHPVHRAQLLTYLRMTDRRLGLLLNFHVAKMIDGVHRIAN